MVTSRTWRRQWLFGQVAGEAGRVRRIVYLGGLGQPEADLSQHLRSRQETGRALREGGVPVTEFRAAVIVGSGSISFEMIRYVVERLPVMVCPRWVYSPIQPIAVDDVLDCLAAAPTNVACADKIMEIGRREVTTYKGMMLGYVRAEPGTQALASAGAHAANPISCGLSYG